MIQLVKTDLVVHPLCLGGNVFGFSADVANSEAVLSYYFDNGGNFIDTADMYSQWAPGHVGGESETIIGNWMKTRGNRSKMVIATKVAKLDTKPGLKAANIKAACEDSLKRLQTDYIDLYYAHQDDLDTPIEETLNAFDSLIKEGKVRYIAASNFTPDRLQESLDIAKANNLPSYVASQDQYNLLDRDYEKGLMPTIQKNGLVQIPFYGLARGFLTGKYRPGVTVESVRATGVANSYANERGWNLLTKLDQIAKDKNTTVAAVSLAWLRAQPTVATPIASATKLEQIKEIMPVVELTSDQLQLLTNS
jgi:aryl-alcohol dehydrogenase-like predicted oxidoreductase